MKWNKNLLSCAGLAAAVLLAGCSHLYYADPNPSNPYAFPDQKRPVTVASRPNSAPTNLALTNAAKGGTGSILTSSQLSVGDLVTVTFADLPAPGMLPHTERIRDDGRITLPLNISVMAAGRNAGQLQEDIRNAYVPQYFVRLTVTIKTEERFYFVGGEVRNANRQLFSGEMSVLKAIDTAGGFNDFANRKNIELTRANGEKHKINWFKAVKDSKLDLPVFPNDQVIVHKKAW